MQLSVVTTVFRSQDYLVDFIELQLKAITELSIRDFELVFVLDGISDNSKQVLLSLAKKIPQIKILELSRNFGHHYAFAAGLKFASGNLTFLIDCDLEVSPEVLVVFKNTMDAEDADVVYGVQNRRKGNWFEILSGEIFWWLFNLLSEVKVPHNIVTERLLTRSYLDSLNSLGDKNLFLAGMMYWVGYKQVPITVNKLKRNGKTTYSLAKKIGLLTEAITSFSELPLKAIFYIGSVITAMSFIIITFLIAKKLLHPGTILIGYTSLIVVQLLSLGILTSTVGLVGIYISRIFRQTQNRPIYIVKGIY